MASIKDVAKAAGVSVSTVSRTINDHPSIPSKTKDKVLEAIKALNYSPNRMAQALSNNNSYTITLIVDIEDEQSYYNPFFQEVMHGIEKVVYSKEYCLIVSNLNTTLRDESVMDWLIKGKRTEGIILPSSIMNAKMAKKLKANQIPFVVIGEPANMKDSVNWVDINNRKAGEQAANFFIDQNRTKIALMGYDESKVFNRRRFEGYRLALDNSGIAYDPGLVKEGGNTRDDGYNMMRALLNEQVVPDAVICADHIMGVGAIKAIQDAGRSIPQDISLISFDNAQIAELTYPKISTINVDVYGLGMQSAKLLFEFIENPGTREREIFLSTVLEERETTQSAT